MMEYEDFGISREEFDTMSPREKLMFEYNIIFNQTRWKINDAIKFIENVDENIIPKDEKKKIMKKMEKAAMDLEYPFDLKLNKK